MQLLKDKILNDGQAIGSEIVKVDSFLNHQMDTLLLKEIGEEFKRRFSGRDVTKVLTIEASGIAVACMTALAFGGVPAVFAKKTAPNTMVDGFYKAQVKSFTKGTVSEAVVSKKYIKPGDLVLIVDDFLAHGEAALGLTKLVEQAGAQVSGIGAVIEKEFQGGGKKLKERGYKVESLAVITSIQDGNIQFR